MIGKAIQVKLRASPTISEKSPITITKDRIIGQGKYKLGEEFNEENRCPKTFLQASIQWRCHL
jgi:hypothetical protein